MITDGLRKYKKFFVRQHGEVGSGKSTLIQILQKHYFPESGKILFNNKHLSEYSTPQWREYIGVVSQHVKIFNGRVTHRMYLAEISSRVYFLENG